MSEIPSELKYAKTHEWARLEEDGTVTVGITDHAQDALGDVVFVEWERPDGTVVRVKRVGCRRGLQSFERYVEDRRGGGGGGTSCTEGGPI